MKLENIMLNEVSQVQKDRLHVFSHMRKQMQTQAILYVLYQVIFPKVELLEENKGGGKEVKNDRESIILKNIPSV
jgi:hypothetical protein